MNVNTLGTVDCRGAERCGSCGGRSGCGSTDSPLPLAPQHVDYEQGAMGATEQVETSSSGTSSTSPSVSCRPFPSRLLYLPKSVLSKQTARSLRSQRALVFLRRGLESRRNLSSPWLLACPLDHKPRLCLGAATCQTPQSNQVTSTT